MCDHNSVSVMRLCAHARTHTVWSSIKPTRPHFSSLALKAEAEDMIKVKGHTETHVGSICAHTETDT